MYSSDQILAHLDQYRRRFVCLDGGKEIPGDVRLTVYRDDERWAIVIEKLSFLSALRGLYGIHDALYKFGNCISGSQGSEGNDAIYVTSDDPEKPAFLPPEGLDLDPSIRFVRIRGASVPVDLSLGALQRKEIPLPRGRLFKTRSPGGELVDNWAPAKLGGKHLLWSLLPEHRDPLLATEEEKRCRLPPDIPKFMQLEQWNHPLLMTQQLMPSDSETFRLLSEAIASGDSGSYLPTLSPNTHWKNWLGFERV